MKEIPKKLNYKGQKRIAILNTDDTHLNFFVDCFGLGVVIDTKIDLRFPYDFMLVFVDSAAKIKELTPSLLHNLVYDGIVWFCFPAHKNRGLTAKRGWKSLFEAGLSRKKVVQINENLIAVKFKNPGFEP